MDSAVERKNIYLLYNGKDSDPEVIETYEEAVVTITAICSEYDESVNGLGIILNYVNEDGKEICVFKSSKVIVGQDVWVSRVVFKERICEECEGNGIIEINDYRQTEECFICNGKGMLRDKTEFVKKSGPYKVIAVDMKLDNSWEKNRKLNPEKDWITLESKEGRFLSVHLSQTFDTEKEADEYVNQFNQVKEAEEKATTNSITTSQQVSIEAITKNNGITVDELKKTIEKFEKKELNNVYEKTHLNDRERNEYIEMIKKKFELNFLKKT